MTYNKANIDELIKLIRKTMIDNDVNNNMLATNMGNSKQYISNLLSSRTDNININLLCDIVTACNCQLMIDIVPIDRIDTNENIQEQ